MNKVVFFSAVVAVMLAVCAVYYEDSRDNGFHGLNMKAKNFFDLSVVDND